MSDTLWMIFVLIAAWLGSGTEYLIARRKIRRANALADHCHNYVRMALHGHLDYENVKQDLDRLLREYRDE